MQMQSTHLYESAYTFRFKRVLFMVCVYFDVLLPRITPCITLRVRTQRRQAANQRAHCPRAAEAQRLSV